MGPLAFRQDADELAATNDDPSAFEVGDGSVGAAVVLPAEDRDVGVAVGSVEQVGGDVEDVKDVMASIADKGARLAAGFAPKRSGDLAATIRGNRAKSRAVVTAGRGSSVSYAGVQNYGWPKRNIPANGFMQRADNALQPIALRDLDRGLERAIRRRGLA